MEEKTYISDDKKVIFYREWKVEKAKGTIHINHGIAEHSARYDEFALFMNKSGFSVYAQDHRGHGRTKTEEEIGWFSKEGGWDLICQDSYKLDTIIESEEKDIPHFIFGHSMGSFVTRTNIALHPSSYKAVVLCGTGGSQGIISKIGKKLSEIRIKKYGDKNKDKVLDDLAFSSYNKKFKEEGDFAWLSSDRTEVEKYIADPDAGFLCTSSFYRDLITGSIKANDKKIASLVNKEVPILFVSGTLDPVGDFGKGVIKSSELYKKVGVKDVRVKLFEKGRHEILKDNMRKDVLETIVSFYKEFV